MKQETLKRLFSEFPRLWAVRHEWYPPTTEVTVDTVTMELLTSPAPAKEENWFCWVFTSSEAGGQRVMPLRPYSTFKTILEVMGATGSSLHSEDREFLVIDRPDKIMHPHPLGLGQIPLSIRRVTVYRPPDGCRTFNHLLRQ